MKHIIEVTFALVLSVWVLSACDNPNATQNVWLANEDIVKEISEDTTREVYRTRPSESTRLPEQRVYLWDVSESLGENGNNLWTSLQNNLIDAITAIPINPLNKIVLIPFYSFPQTPIVENATEEGVNRIIKAIEDRGSNPESDKSLGGNQYTNIAAAIQKFHQIAKPGYKNYMFLYTDGKQEDSKGKICMSLLKEELDKWTSNNSSGTKKYGFYYLVHDDADNPYVHNTEQEHNNFWVIDKADVSIKIIGFSDGYTYNVYARDTLDKGNKLIGITGDYKNFEGHIRLIASDSLYNLSFNPNVKDGYVEVNVTPKRSDIPEGVYSIRVSVDYDGYRDNYSFVENSTFIITCVNKREHCAEVNLRMESQENNIGRTSYYPDFCFGLSDEKIVSQKATIDVKYNLYAEKKSSFDLIFVDENKIPLKYDEFKIVADGDTLSSKNSSIHISGTTNICLEFIPFENTIDKYYAGYIIVSNNCDIDRINGKETNSEDDIIVEWNFKHDIKWNPLKKIGMIVLLLFVLALSIWFLFLQKICYRRFKNIAKLLVIPNQAPIQLRFRGARMIVLSPHNNKQSIWDQIFKGKIIYKTIPTLAFEIRMKPTNKGRSISVHGNNMICNPNPVGQFNHATIKFNNNNVQYQLN